MASSMRIFAATFGSTLWHYTADYAIASGENLLQQPLDDAVKTNMSCASPVAVATSELQCTRDDALMMPNEKERIVNVANERSLAACSTRIVHEQLGELALNYLNDQAKSYGEPLAAKIKGHGISIVLGIGVFERDSLNGADSLQRSGASAAVEDEARLSTSETLAINCGLHRQ